MKKTRLQLVLAKVKNPILHPTLSKPGSIWSSSGRFSSTFTITFATAAAWCLPTTTWTGEETAEKKMMFSLRGG